MARSNKSYSIPKEYICNHSVTLSLEEQVLLKYSNSLESQYIEEIVSILSLVGIDLYGDEESYKQLFKRYGYKINMLKTGNFNSGIESDAKLLQITKEGMRPKTIKIHTSDWNAAEINAQEEQLRYISSLTFTPTFHWTAKIKFDNIDTGKQGHYRLFLYDYLEAIPLTSEMLLSPLGPIFKQSHIELEQKIQDSRVRTASTYDNIVFLEKKGQYKLIYTDLANLQIMD